MQYEHIGGLISFAREIQEKGVRKMEFGVFDKSSMEQYKQEVKERWGQSEAYREFMQRQRDGEDFNKSGTLLLSLFTGIGRLR